MTGSLCELCGKQPLSLCIGYCSRVRQQVPPPHTPGHSAAQPGAKQSSSPGYYGVLTQQTPGCPVICWNCPLLKVIAAAGWHFVTHQLGHVQGIHKTLRCTFIAQHSTAHRCRAHSSAQHTSAAAAHEDHMTEHVTQVAPACCYAAASNRMQPKYAQSNHTNHIVCILGAGAQQPATTVVMSQLELRPAELHLPQCRRVCQTCRRRTWGWLSCGRPCHGSAPWAAGHQAQSWSVKRTQRHT
jgi:hypothetical protein